MTSKTMEISHEHAMEGLEMQLGQLGPSMMEQVDGLTQKQLRRLLKSSIEYIYSRKVTTDEASLTEREKKFLGSLGALIEMGFSYQQYVFRQLEEETSKQQDNQES